MTAQRQPVEQVLAEWMIDEAAGAPEQLLAEILGTTGRTAPSPRVWALVAEPTLRGRTTRAAVGLPNRGFVLAAGTALLVAALTGLAVGAYLLLNQKPAEGGDWPGFRGDAARTGSGLLAPKGNPVTAWQIRVEGAVSEVVVLGEHVYFASDDGNLHAVSRDSGLVEWTVMVAEPPLTGPFAADGRLYLSDSTGTFHAYGIEDGRAIWTSGTRYAQPSRAVEVDGTLYFGTDDGLVVALDAATGAERWRLQPPGATHVDAPAFADGRLFAGTDGGGFVAIDTVARHVAWTGNTDGEDTGSATVADGIAYIGAGAQTNATGTLHAFDAATGRPLWTAADPDFGLPTIEAGIAYTTSLSGRLDAIDTATGATRWSVDLEGDPRSPMVVGGVVFLPTGAARRIEAIEASTGNELWRYDIDANADCCVTVAKGMVFVGTQSGSVYAIAGDGATITARSRSTLEPTQGPNPSGSASVAPAATPLPSIGTVAWSTDIRGMGFAPISQIAIDPTTGRIWAPEAAADRIAIFAPDGTLLEEWGESGNGNGQFDFTRGNGDGYGTLAFGTDGSFYVLDVGNRRVQQFDAARRFVRAWGAFGSRPYEFIDPVGIAVAPDGTVWILDDVRRVVEHYTADGTVLGSFDPFAPSPINNGANALAIDAAGNLYVSGVQPSQISVFDPSGRFVRFIGAGQFAEQATQMAIDAGGRIFVTQGPDRGAAPGILAFGPNGQLLSGFGPRGDGDGELNFPAGIALDGEGGLYVEDSLPESARLMRLQLLPPAAPAP